MHTELAQIYSVLAAGIFARFVRLFFVLGTIATPAPLPTPVGPRQVSINKQSVAPKLCCINFSIKFGGPASDLGACAPWPQRKTAPECVIMNGYDDDEDEEDLSGNERPPEHAWNRRVG